MARWIKRADGSIWDDQLESVFDPNFTGARAYARNHPELAALLEPQNGNSTTRMAGEVFTKPAKESAEIHIPARPMRRENVYTNENVVNTERELLELFHPELNAVRANERNNGVDILTDIGPIDIQYQTKPGLPFVDLISAGNFDGVRRRLPSRDIDKINRAIANDIRDGANMQEILSGLKDSDFTMYKPGKLLNTGEYPAVASVLRREGTNLMSVPTVLDLARLSSVVNNTPLNELGMGVRFNLKDGKRYSQGDNFESAFVTISPRIASEFDITSEYFI